MSEKSFLQLDTIGTAAVRKLRATKLNQGKPFMINSRELPKNFCYLEFPDGKIKLVTLSQDRRDFVVVRELSDIEGTNIRRRFDLERF